MVSAERQVSVYDQITFGPSNGDKKIETSSAITTLGFHGDKVYAGLRNCTVEIFSQSDLSLVKKVETGDTVTCIYTLESTGIILGQDNG